MERKDKKKDSKFTQLLRLRRPNEIGLKEIREKELSKLTTKTLAKKAISLKNIPNIRRIKKTSISLGNLHVRN